MEMSDYANEGGAVDVIYHDLVRLLFLFPVAFLFESWGNLGLINRVPSGLKTWLNHWSQITVINNLTVNCWLVMSVVPQGSSLGLLVFKTFINDMDDDGECNVN